MLGQTKPHGPECPHPLRGECLLFSTDGTRMGAEIAHAMGTDDEDEIVALSRFSIDGNRHLTGMAEEQAEWESGL